MEGHQGPEVHSQQVVGVVYAYKGMHILTWSAILCWSCEALIHHTVRLRYDQLSHVHEKLCSGIKPEI